MTWHNYFMEDGVSRLCRLAQRKGITVKLVPVPERDDQEINEYRGWVVVELCDPPTTEIPNCWVSNPAKPLVAIDQAIGYLLYKESEI